MKPEEAEPQVTMMPGPDTAQHSEATRTSAAESLNQVFGVTYNPGDLTPHQDRTPLDAEVLGEHAQPSGSILDPSHVISKAETIKDTIKGHSDEPAKTWKQKFLEKLGKKYPGDSIQVSKN